MIYIFIHMRIYRDRKPILKSEMTAILISVLTLVTLVAGFVGQFCETRVPKRQEPEVTNTPPESKEPVTGRREKAKKTSKRRIEE